MSKVKKSKVFGPCGHFFNHRTPHIANSISTSSQTVFQFHHIQYFDSIAFSISTSSQTASRPHRKQYFNSIANNTSSHPLFR